MSHEKPPIDFLEKARKKGKNISRDDIKNKDLERDFSVEKTVGNKITDLDEEKARREKTKGSDYFDPRKELEKIGVDYYRKVESFLKNVNVPIDELKLRSYKNEVKNYSDKRLLENYNHFEPSFWLNSLEYYTAIFNEVKRRYQNK